MRLRVASIAAPIAFLVPGLVLAPACSSQADRICALVCECEHCSDVREDLECTSWNGEEELAAAYECSAPWERYAICVEDRGSCDDATAEFSTRGEGSCPECNDGPDRCTEERAKLDECYLSKSDDPSVRQPGGPR
jgi:hypothetical protein